MISGIEKGWMDGQGVFFFSVLFSQHYHTVTKAGVLKLFVLHRALTVRKIPQMPSAQIYFMDQNSTIQIPHII